MALRFQATSDASPISKPPISPLRGFSIFEAQVSGSDHEQDHEQDAASGRASDDGAHDACGGDASDGVGV
jgi:hypothetical protein